jgi:hypothetical protein
MHQPSVRGSRGVRAAGLALLAAVVLALAACSSAAAPPTSDPTAEGTALVNKFFTILQQPAADKVAQLKTFLAPEFQIVRDTGDHLDKDAYLQNPASVTTYSLSDLVATQGSDVLVVSYVVTTEETINGVTQSTAKPRLSVFHWTDGAWHLAAHSNFGALPK